MASLSQVTKTKRRNRRRKAGKKRRLQMSRRSTLSYAELFEGFGTPGEPKDSTAK